MNKSFAATERLIEAGIVAEADLQGCSETDIADLEARLSLRLPPSYKAFLRTMGRGAGGFLRQDHWTAFYDDLASLNAEVRDDLEGIPIPAPWFCTATRMGEIYFFLDTSEQSNDPPVLCWSESTDPDLVVAYASFWDWVDLMIDDAVG